LVVVLLIPLFGILVILTLLKSLGEHRCIFLFNLSLI